MFIIGLGLCVLSLMSGVVVVLVEVPLFSTRQIEELSGVALGFWTGVATSFLSALGWAAVEYVERRWPSPTDAEAEADDGIQN